MPRFVVQKLSKLMNDQGKALKGSRILLLGMAYKPNINDLRESPGLDIWQLLDQEWGADVVYHDPYIQHLHEFDADSIELTNEELNQADAVVIVTNHKDFDYKQVCQHAKLILDARHAIKEDHDNVTRL